ncbi:LysR family transcriptional regulator [Burkholderia pseudomallei 1258a]|uniref:LysR family transcriptional regulator n=1 Tax=Burkholderia pseudomallei TaxID=28450 RepID=UPI00025C2AA1|nr:LysR family transcriptional regulator [Burkholderia pseudomallei]EIF52321.1 LysR family transcriptional regulator [Burkholderia pseudomallei 1258a]EIF65401.1 LysR family transcriptional regulator [Burkholderia pseudomallei 1258b]MBF3542409.1 LysR family transcriptional regulator [Burkholderia pseudomallei]MWJ57964.1 LysR family transcriptional regulator [Burkholderia pseudomallei]CAJ7744132.1 LysR family transcriptional regulator [Burkholderia pseudomallei]
MRHSPEALLAFAEAANLGSFSAAARKLGKRQSTVSEAIANLEIDLGVTLFDRSTRQPTLTDAARALLPEVQRVLEASEAIDQVAARLAGGEEARLTLVVSDTYQSSRYEETLAALDRRFPTLEFECQIAEHDDVLDLIQQGRAQLGLMAARSTYPPDIGAATISERSEIGLYVGPQHALAAYGDAEVPLAALHDTRELRLNTYVAPRGERVETGLVAGRRCWLAPSYLQLLEMAVAGFGWAELPRWMVEHFARERLVELNARGWPRRVPVDAVWSRGQPLGPAGSWLLETMLAA